MKASLLIHKDEKRIKIDFPYNNDISFKLRQIPDAKWSKTHRAWHIPYSKASFELLKKLFPDVEYPKKVEGIKNEEVENIPKPEEHSEKKIKTPYQKATGVSILVSEKALLLNCQKMIWIPSLFFLCDLADGMLNNFVG
jgi:hypothetical protein